MRRSFDFVLVGVVLAFAFLASSFAVRNSDFWLHLASGRLLAEGRYQFGVDPFSFTTEKYWSNHAWLFDLPLYLLYSSLGERLGGTVLVLLKALLVSLLALVLLSVRRPDGRLGWPSVCTLLAILAMSSRLLLHSTLLSYVLLALTLWLLWRRHYVSVLLLFVLWVNVDGWFLFGPLLAALFWLGDCIAPEREGAANSSGRRTPAWLWLAGLAVCLINPYHLHAFVLPPDLMPLPEALQNDARFAPLHFSPWQMSFYYRPLLGVDLTSCAYLVLLAVGALSFVLNARRLVGWRLLVWLAFAGLSAWLARTIPFFAVVAAPITALNMQDAFGARQETPSRSRLLLLGTADLAVVILALILMALAWPGWLQGIRGSNHPVEWAVQPDSSLRRVAETLHQWRQLNKIDDGRGFLSDSSLVHYCAYFCPEEKGFLDQRLQLFGDVAGAYEEIRQAVNPGVGLGRNRSTSEWRSRLRHWGITHLVLYDRDLRRLFPALQQMAAEGSDTSLLHIDGQALIVGWRDDDRELPRGVPVFQADPLALSTAAEKAADPMIPAAPGQGPGRGPRPDDIWSRFGKPIAPSSWQTDAAGVLMGYFDDRAPFEVRKRLAWAIGLPVLSAASCGSLDGLLGLSAYIELAPPDAQDLGQQSPALPLLAIRAARQALAENPDDASAYRHLGQAYFALVSRTPERLAMGPLPPLAELRHIQIAVALENALRIDPNALLVHEQLAVLYRSRGYLDAELDHRRAALRLMREAGPLGGEAADAFARRLKDSEREVQDIQRIVSDRKNEFATRSRNLGSEPHRKAELALRMGLARLALDDVLAPSSIVLLGGEGIRSQVRLQLMLGQTDPIREQLRDPDWKANKSNLGLITLDVPGTTSIPPYRLLAYEWLLLCLCAAEGDYDEAEEVVKEQVRNLNLSQQNLEPVGRGLKSNMARYFALEMALAASPQKFSQTITNQMRLETAELLHRYAESEKEQARMQAMFRLIAGMLSLERGQTSVAERSFRQVQAPGRQGAASLPNDPAASLAETYLRLMRLHGGSRGDVSAKRRGSS